MRKTILGLGYVVVTMGFVIAATSAHADKALDDSRAILNSPTSGVALTISAIAY